LCGLDPPQTAGLIRQRGGLSFSSIMEKQRGCDDAAGGPWLHGTLGAVPEQGNRYRLRQRGLLL
jgi:hypothetical protein